MKLFFIVTLVFFALAHPGLAQCQDTFNSIVVKAESPALRRNRLVDYDCGFAWVAQDFGDSRDFGGNTTPGVFVHSKATNRWLKILRVSTTGAKFGKSPPEARIQAGWDFTGLASKQFVPLPLPDGGLPISGGQVIHLPDKVVFDKGRDAFIMYFDSYSLIESMTTMLIISQKDLTEAFDFYAKRNSRRLRAGRPRSQ
jgi:hypothetical protein